MKTFYEWLRERKEQQEGLLLGSDGRLKGMSPANPLPKDSAFKSLNQKPKPLPATVFKPWKPAEPARFQPFKPAQPAKIVMQKAQNG